MTFTVHPSVEEFTGEPPDWKSPLELATSSFLVGVQSLLLAIGISGWLRSRTTGVLTSLFAAGATVGVLLAVANGPASDAAVRRPARERGKRR